MKIQCPSCGASFDVNERTQSNVQCPYCGSSIPVKSSDTPCTSARKYQRIIPFKISEQKAMDIMLKKLVETEGVPVDVFQNIENIRVEKYFLPMYMLNGDIYAPWNATQVEVRERKVRDRDGRMTTEYYDEKWPISGIAQSTYWLLSSSNNNSHLPSVLREYGKVIEYTNAMASASISDEVQEINYQLPDGCKEIETDTDSHTVFQSNPVSDYINQIAIQAAKSQIPSSYENFRCSPRWTNNVVELVGVAVYYIQFSYKGETYGFCIDGLGYSCYSNFPQDHNAIELLRKSIRNKRIYTWLLCLFGIAMPLIGTFGITRWPVGLLLAFVAMPIAMLITLLILISKERIAILSNEEEQREYGRRIYCGEDTSGVDGNASTKLRVVTSILLWIGLVVDIAAIIISLTMPNPADDTITMCDTMYETMDAATENIVLYDDVTVENNENTVETATAEVAVDIESSTDVVSSFGEFSIYGTMSDANGVYPIHLEYKQQGNKLSDCIYTNVDLGGKIKMQGTIDGNEMIFTGKDGRMTFKIRVNKYTYSGYAMDGDKRLSVSLDKSTMVASVQEAEASTLAK